jgi:hypothetical protein
MATLLSLSMKCKFSEIPVFYYRVNVSNLLICLKMHTRMMTEIRYENILGRFIYLVLLYSLHLPSDLYQILQ